MILRPEQIKLLRLGMPATPANGGGSSDSNSSQTSNTSTTNDISTADNRVVASDQAIALSGTGNSAVKVSNTTTNFSDSSNKSTNFTDSSTKTTNTSTTNNISTTDYGSVAAALSGMGATASLAIDGANKSIGGAIDVLKLASSNSLDMLGTVLDFAAGSETNANNSYAKALGFAQQAISQTSQAFEQASQSQDNKSLKIAAFAIVAVAAAFAWKR